ncbi:hypothetical protein BAU15_01085 [Enterococcus sp. JM4C]|uniref:DUF4352 domain-containing protein n=1 Tax=Candidatus Enterococcus huntleyi TaxID=1857217 RepID=UPI00137A03AE|nr:DUF4352 domain-containing protein [Enterococcus sp. JM4C]KAF1299270.1 hypothetical protein BAU15_01085 [Enterococcus sp. JM4C]
MKKMVFTSLAVISLLGLSGCGKEEAATTKTSTSETQTSESSSRETETKKESATAGTGDWAEVQTKLKETTEAKNMTTIFEHSEPIVNENNQVSVTINGYQYIKLEDVSRDFRIVFGDQVKEAGVLLISATYENNSDKSVYVGPGFSMSVVGYSSSIGWNPDLLEDNLLSQMVASKNEVKPGETISGYVALSVKPEAMAKIEESGVGELEFVGMYSKPDSFSKDDALVEPGKETITLSKAGETSQQAAAEFYGDKVTADNMGTKTMIEAKEINKTEKFEDVSVTVTGYQVADFEPNEDQASRFSDFETGVVLVTAEVIVKNDGTEALNVDDTSATLAIGNSIKMMSENMLQVDSGADNVGKGQEGTKYLVFTLDKESYDKLYKDQGLVLDVNILNTEFERITSLNDLTFELK